MKNAKRFTSSAGGIQTFVEYLSEAKKPLHKPIYIYKEIDTNIVEIALQYTESYSETLYSYVNNINTHEGGTHLIGFKSALTRTINDYARKNNLLKKADFTLSGDDVREGLTACDQRQDDGPAVRGPDQDQAGQQRDQGRGRVRGERAAGDTPGRKPLALRARSSIRRSMPHKPARRPARPVT